MKTIISFLKSQLVGNIVGLLLGCITGILLNFPYYTALILPFGLLKLPGLVMMVTTGIPQYSDYTTWPHWVPMFHLLAVSIYYTLALLGYGYCGFSVARRTGSAKKGFGAAFWASLITTGVSAVVMALAIIVQSFTGFGSAAAILLTIIKSLGGILMTVIGLSLLMGIASCLVAVFAGAIGVAIGSMHTKTVQIPLTN